MLFFLGRGNHLRFLGGDLRLRSLHGQGDGRFDHFLNKRLRPILLLNGLSHFRLLETVLDRMRNGGLRNRLDFIFQRGD
jgi:hypothetical protein